MKKAMGFLAIVMFLFAGAQCFAQISFGVKAGLNFANRTSKDNDKSYSDNYKMKAGFHLGVVAEYSITEQIALQPGLLFSVKGFKEDQSSISYKINENYLEIPINAVYNMELGGIKVLIHAGPFLGYAISGKVRADKAVLGDNGDQKTEKLNIGNDSQKDFLKPIDFGLNIGGGAEINGIAVSLQYGLGIANIAPNTSNGYTSRNNVIGLSVSYKLGSL